LKTDMLLHMARGAAALAAVWDMAAKEAGVFATTGFPTKSVSVEDPAWMPLPQMSK